MNKKMGFAVILAVLLAIVVMLQLNSTEEMGGTSSTDMASTATETAQSADSEPDFFSFDRKQVAELARSKGPSTLPRKRKPRVPSIVRTTDESFPRILKQAEVEIDAAPVYQTIFDRMKTSAAAETFAGIEALMNKGTGAWSERYLSMDDADKEHLLQMLRSPEVSEITALMQEAAVKDGCDFQLDYSQGFHLSLPHLSPMRQLARLSTLQTLAHLDLDDPDAALGAAEVGLAVGRDAAGDKLLISRLVGIAADRTILDSLVGLAQQPNLPTERAYSVLVELAKRDYVADMSTAIEFESEMAYQTIHDLAQNPALLEHQLGEDLAPDVRAMLRDETFVAQNIANIRNITAQYVQVSKLPPAEIREAIAALNKEVEMTLAQPEAFFARQLMPSYGATIMKAQSAVAELDTVYVDVVTAIYRSQHGRDPQSLEDLEGIIQQARAYENQ